MKKQTKNIITRASVEKELRLQGQHHIRQMAIRLAILVPLLALLLFCLRMIFSKMFDVIGMTWGALITILEMIVVLALGVLFVVILMHETITDRIRLKNGEFEIVVREMQYKREDLVGRHLEEQLCFEGFHPATVGHTIYELAESGDAYYIVHYKGKKDIKLLYPLKMYEYKEC